MNLVDIDATEPIIAARGNNLKKQILATVGNNLGV